MSGLFWVVNDTTDPKSKKVVLTRVDSPLGLSPVVLITNEADISTASEKPFSELVTWKGAITGDKLELAYTAVTAKAATTLNGDSTIKASTLFTGVEDNVSFAIHATNAQNGGSAHLADDGDTIIPERAGKVKVWAIINGERVASVDLTVKTLLTVKASPVPFHVDDNDADASRWFDVAPATLGLSLSIKTAKPDVATLTHEGRLHAVGAGDITVTGTAEDGTTKDVVVHVLINPLRMPPTNLAAQPDLATAKGGSTLSLHDMFDVSGVAPADLDFTVSPTAAGDIDLATGALALKPATKGKVTVKAKTKASATVTLPEVTFTITNVIEKATITAKTAPKFNLTDADKPFSDFFTIAPTSAPLRVTVKSGGTFAEIKADKVHAKAAGTFKLEATTDNGDTKELEVTITVEGVTAKHPTANLLGNGTLDVKTLFNVVGSGTVTYDMTTPAAGAAATKAGDILTPAKDGSVTIEATYAGNPTKAQVVVTVKPIITKKANPPRIETGQAGKGAADYFTIAPTGAAMTLSIVSGTAATIVGGLITPGAAGAAGGTVKVKAESPNADPVEIDVLINVPKKVIGKGNITGKAPDSVIPADELFDYEGGASKADVTAVTGTGVTWDNKAKTLTVDHMAADGDITVSFTAGVAKSGTITIKDIVAVPRAPVVTFHQVDAPSSKGEVYFYLVFGTADTWADNKMEKSTKYLENTFTITADTPANVNFIPTDDLTAASPVWSVLSTPGAAGSKGNILFTWKQDPKQVQTIEVTVNP
ncbi:hypothetical protein UXN85_20955 [Enterobacter hormaechei]